MSTLANILKKESGGFIADIKSEWNRFPNIVGNADISFKITKDDFDFVAGVFSAEGQKMWMLEHGSGSRMDNEEENPDLADYKRSEYWNKERGHGFGSSPSGTEIRTRAKMPMYSDLDNNYHHGSGAAMPHGLNAEWSMNGRNTQKVIPVEPQHIIKETLAPSSGSSARIRKFEDDIYAALGEMVDIAVGRGSGK